MADRLFVDLTADGRVSVSTWLEGELPGGATGEPAALGWPLDARTVRVTQRDQGEADAQDHIIEVVVTETIRAAAGQEHAES